MIPDKLNSIYFLGIGGIGMSSLARYFHQKGIKVLGYDRSPSRLTEELMAEGIDIHFEDNPSLIPSDVDLIIYTPAIPSDNLEYSYIVEKGIPMMKRSQNFGMAYTRKTNYCHSWYTWKNYHLNDDGQNSFRFSFGLHCLFRRHQ
jgi:UDP-N-acetylmuramate--alanine ligase